MARISHAVLRATAKRILTSAGFRYNDKPWSTIDGHNVVDVGSVSLERGIGGWNIVQICNEGGGQRHINGWCNQFTAAEMYAFLQGMEAALAPKL